jgi:hypothetical protein
VQRSEENGSLGAEVDKKHRSGAISYVEVARRSLKEETKRPDDGFGDLPWKRKKGAG